MFKMIFIFTIRILFGPFLWRRLSQ